MSRLRFAVTLVEALAVALALIAPCPCESAPKARPDTHVCCNQPQTAVAATGGCCSHCGLSTGPVGAEPASDPTSLPAVSVTADATAVSALPAGAARAPLAILAARPPSVSSQRPLRI